MRLKLVIVSTVFLMFLVIPNAGAVGIDFNLALGAQFEGSISDVDFDTDEGFSLGLELMFDLPLIDVGVGYEYGFPRDGQHIEDLEYHYVYGIGRLTLLGPVYLVGRYGWADVSVNDLDSDYSKLQLQDRSHVQQLRHQPRRRLKRGLQQLRRPAGLHLLGSDPSHVPGGLPGVDELRQPQSRRSSSSIGQWSEPMTSG